MASILEIKQNFLRRPSPPCSNTRTFRGDFRYIWWFNNGIQHKSCSLGTFSTPSNFCRWAEDNWNWQGSATITLPSGKVLQAMSGPSTRGQGATANFPLAMGPARGATCPQSITMHDRVDKASYTGPQNSSPSCVSGRTCVTLNTIGFSGRRPPPGKNPLVSKNGEPPISLGGENCKSLITITWSREYYTKSRNSGQNCSSGEPGGAVVISKSFNHTYFAKKCRRDYLWEYRENQRCARGCIPRPGTAC